MSKCPMCNHEPKTLGEAMGQPETYVTVNAMSRFQPVRITPDAVPCECIFTAPTYPVYRDNPHLPSCPNYKVGASRALELMF